MQKELFLGLRNWKKNTEKLIKKGEKAMPDITYVSLETIMNLHDAGVDITINDGKVSGIWYEV